MTFFSDSATDFTTMKSHQSNKICLLLPTIKAVANLRLEYLQKYTTVALPEQGAGGTAAMVGTCWDWVLKVHTPKQKKGASPYQCLQKKPDRLPPFL